MGGLDWAPDGSEIAFDHRRSPDVGGSGTADISIVTVADGKVRPLVTQAGPDSRPVFSPDGSRVAFESAMAREGDYYRNGQVAVVPRAGGAPVSLTAAFDESPSLLDWGPNGIWMAAGQKTEAGLFRLDPDTKAIARVPLETAPDRVRLRLRPRVRARGLRRARARPRSRRPASLRPRAGPSRGSAVSASR